MFEQYTKYFSNMYFDKFSIKRYVEIKNDDGTTDVSEEPEVILSDIPCRLSVIKEDEHNLKSDDVNVRDIKFKLFCNPDVEVKKGDMLEIKVIKNNITVQIVSGIAGQPAMYDISQEIRIKSNEVA